MRNCTKRRFGSVRAARAAHVRAHWRVRVYRCERCGGFHVCNNEKRKST